MKGTSGGSGILTNSIALRSGLAFESPRPVREDRREVRVAARAGDLKHIFLIAGPSGSGKSTIMSEFVYDRLPKDISDSLPPEAKNWQRTSGNELSREGLARIRARHARTPGLVVHYDIMRPFAKRFERYANDPAIKELTASGAALTVLTWRRTARFCSSSSSSAPPIATMSSGGTGGAGRARSSARSAERSTGSPARSRSS